MAKKVENVMTMRLFHGSRAGIEGKIAPISRPECDFGKGFYLGTESSQPLTLICRSESPVLYTCSFDLSGLRVYRFAPTIDWALFIAYCRKRMPAKFRRLFARAYEPILKGNDVICGECRKLQERSERQRVRAAAIVDEIMDANRRDGLLFREILEKKAEELDA